MRIDEFYTSKGSPVLSFEVFPPKRDADFSTVEQTCRTLAGLRPDFISVTYGAGGGPADTKTIGLAHKIQNSFGIASLVHLTCLRLSEDDVRVIAQELRRRELTNVLALRGDFAPDETQSAILPHYRLARDLMCELEPLGFCVGGAAYPEGHIDCSDADVSLVHLLEKQRAGARFFITQLFFDNAYFFDFVSRARHAGITAPISAGIMPILSRAQIERMIFLCGASLPSGIIKLLNRYGGSGEALKDAGIEYACRQMRGLLQAGVDGVHIYTMNHPEIAEYCVTTLRGEGLLR